MPRAISYPVLLVQEVQHPLVAGAQVVDEKPAGLDGHATFGTVEGDVGLLPSPVLQEALGDLLPVVHDGEVDKQVGTVGALAPAQRASVYLVVWRRR